MVGLHRHASAISQWRHVACHTTIHRRTDRFGLIGSSGSRWLRAPRGIRMPERDACGFIVDHGSAHGELAGGDIRRTTPDIRTSSGSGCMLGSADCCHGPSVA